MVSRPDGPIPGELGPDEGDLPSVDIPDIPEPLADPDLPDDGLLEPDDE